MQLNRIAIRWPNFRTINAAGSYHEANYQQDDFIENKSSPSGNPHYSPGVNLSWEKNEIMIADIDPEIQAPYWVKIENIFQSMSHCNPAFNIPRGWLVLRKRH